MAPMALKNENGDTIPKQDIHGTFVIEGVITDLHVAVGIENLLDQITPYRQSAGAVAGRANLLSECRGRIRATLVSMGNDDDDIQNFVCLVGHRVVCGSFAGTGKLPVGNTIKAVVKKGSGVLIACAILSEDTGLVWANCQAGAKAGPWGGYDMTVYLSCFTVVGATMSVFFLDTDASMSRFKMGASTLVITVALCIFFWLIVRPHVNPLTDPATDIFRKLGFADPEYVNLSAYQYDFVHPREGIHSRSLIFEHASILCYKKAIEDGKLKLAE